MNPPPSRPTPTSNPHPATLTTQLTTELLSRHSLPVSPAWLSQFLSTARSPAPPLPALTSTAHFRLLNSDFTDSLVSTAPSALLLPPGVCDVTVKSTTLQWNIPLQVLSVEDTGTSRYAQIEAIERVERGEEVKGREVVRVLPDGEAEGDPIANSNATAVTSGASVKRSSGPHKLLLQDAAGIKVYGFEASGVPKLFMTNVVEDGGVNIGCKVLVRKGTVVRRGMVMLTADGTTVLGGKVEAWDKLWRGGRKERLKSDMARDTLGKVDLS